MASLKVFFVALIACSALVNTEAAAVQHRNIINDIEKFVEYEKLLEETINQYLQNVEKTVQAVTEALTNDLNQAFEETQKLFEFVAKIKNEAELRGDDYKACIKEQLPKIQKLTEETEVAQAACTEASKQDIAAIKERLIQQLAEVNKDVAALFEEAKKCKDFECVKDTEVKVFETVAAAKALVRAAFDEAVTIVKEKSPEAVACVVAASDNFKAEMKKVVADVYQCVEK